MQPPWKRSNQVAAKAVSSSWSRRAERTTPGAGEATAADPDGLQVRVSSILTACMPARSWPIVTTVRPEFTASELGSQPIGSGWFRQGTYAAVGTAWAWSQSGSRLPHLRSRVGTSVWTATSLLNDEAKELMARITPTMTVIRSMTRRALQRWMATG